MRRLSGSGLAAAAVLATGAVASTFGLLAGSAQAAGPSYLGLVEAGSGAIVERDGGQLRVRLDGVDRSALFFTERPDHQAGETSTRSLIGRFFKSGADNPNAVLRLHGAKAANDALALELSHPVFSRRGRTLTFSATLLTAASRGLSRFDSKVDRTLPRRFAASTLFLDSYSQQCTVQINYPTTLSLMNYDAHSDFGGSVGVGPQFAPATLGSPTGATQNVITAFQEGTWDYGCGGTITADVYDSTVTPAAYLGQLNFRWQDPEIGSNSYDFSRSSPSLAITDFTGQYGGGGGSTPEWMIAFDKAPGVSPAP